MKTAGEIVIDIRAFVSAGYPDMQVTVEPWSEDPARLAISFVDEKFAQLYPMQRFHYLSHLIPVDYQEQYLANTVWFELAPGESPRELEYPDEELIAEITPDVMLVLTKTGFFAALDEAFSPGDPSVKPATCWGDFRVSKNILPSRSISPSEYFDVFHVLMQKGGFCDCEILYNAAPTSRLREQYWQARARGEQPGTPHSGAHWRPV